MRKRISMLGFIEEFLWAVQTQKKKIPVFLQLRARYPSVLDCNPEKLFVSNVAPDFQLTCFACRISSSVFGLMMQTNCIVPTRFVLTGIIRL